jgi:hypothetical protein
LFQGDGFHFFKNAFFVKKIIEAAAVVRVLSFSLLSRGHVFVSRQGLVLEWSFLRFLDESVQEDDASSCEIEETSGDAGRQSGAQFPKSVAEAADQRHSERPTELKSFEIFANSAALVGRQIFQPISNRFIARLCTEKDNG